MVKGLHAMLYSSDAAALRAFFRDKLGFPATDVGGGWLIFELPDAELGCHPSDLPDGEPSGTHHLSFFCDDIEATVRELKAKGIEFVDGVADKGYGLATHFRVPGGFTLELFQPHYARDPG